MEVVRNERRTLEGYQSVMSSGQKHVAFHHLVANVIKPPNSPVIASGRPNDFAPSDLAQY
jgi:hypothetical protein